MEKTLLIFCSALLIGGFTASMAGCSKSLENRTGSTITIQPKQKKQATPEEKKKFQDHVLYGEKS